MGQEADLPLLLQAHKLLHQVSLAPHAEGLSTELFSLAARCHQDMLELGESDRSGAIDLAIAGADLIQAHQSLGEAGKDLPDWVHVIEEQLCRYGSIWINNLLKEGSPLTQPRRERAASLLRRLQELHSESLPWIATMLQDLQPNPANPTSDTDLRLVIVGNCQAHPIYLGLQQALPQARIHFCPSVHLADHDDVARLHRRLRDADLLVMQRVQPGYRDNIGLDSITLGSLLPPTGRSVVLPNLHYEGHHPWIGYAHDPDGRLAAVEGESPLGPYHDFLAMAAAKGGQPPEMLLDPACPMPVLDLLREQHPASLAQLQQREVECDLALSDWLDSQHRHLPLAHTINHPTQVVLDQVLRNLLAHLGLPHQLGEGLFDATEHLGALTIPIHPWVRQALQLDPWAETWGQRDGSALSFKQQIQESISFYRRYPWIAEANAQHPKLQLAELLLHEALIATTPPTPPLQAPTIYDCLWVSTTPLQALRELGQWVLAQPPGDHGQLQQLVEVASRTRDPDLITPALDRLTNTPPPEPWRSHFALQLQQAGDAPADQRRRLAREAFETHLSGGHPWDELSWRSIAVHLHDEDDPDLQASLQALLAKEAPLEQACYRGLNPNLEPILAARAGIDLQDAKLAAAFYASSPPSMRKPFAHWADPDAAEPAVLESLVDRIQKARDAGRGFSLVRLGDGEGLFLCGRRPDIGGAISNGALIDGRLAAQGNRLEDPEHEQLRLRLTAAVANADWIGIPDPHQCLSGPIDCLTVASGLHLMLNLEQRQRALANLVVGGCHTHNYLLQAGCFSRAPFDRVQSVIGPSLPANLSGQSELLWLQIPGEAGFRTDAFGDEAHYPRVFDRILLAIDQRISPGDLVLVGAGILGKIYCEAIRQRGGIAIDVGSVIDLCSGHGATRGEYRMNPWLQFEAREAFRLPASSPSAASC